MVQSPNFNYRRVVLVNLGLLFCIIFLAELVFGNWIFHSRYDIPDLRLSETRHFDVSTLIEAGKVVTYTRDRFGFRGEFGEDPSNIDVLVIGGSTTDERFLGDEETWVSQLQGKFRLAKRIINFANAGVDGQSTNGHIFSFDRWFLNIPNLNPRYVIGYLGVNDTAVGQVRDRYDRMKSPEFSRQLRYYLMKNSVFYDHFRRIRGTLRARRAHLVHGSNAFRTGRWVKVQNWTNRTQLERDLKPKLESYRERLIILTQRIRKFGAKAIFVTQRRGDFRFEAGELLKLVQLKELKSGVIPSDSAMVMLSLFNKITLSVCEEMELTCVDLGEDIELSPTDFYDGIHTMPSGSEKIAEFLFTRLKDTLR